MTDIFTPEKRSWVMPRIRGNTTKTMRSRETYITAEALMGHSFYMDTYYQLPEDKKKQMYLDAESYLTISDFETVEKNIKKLSEKNSQLEEKFNDLLQYLRTNKIEVPSF